MRSGVRANGWEGGGYIAITSRTFHALSDIRLKPGEGPVELDWPLFRAKGKRR